MTEKNKNSIVNNPLSKQEEKFFERIEKAISEDDVISFENSLEKTFPHRTVWQQSWVRIAAIFVAVATLSSLAYYYCTPLNKRLYVQYYVQFKVENSTGIMRGGDETWDEAFRFYSEKQFEKAQTEFSKVLKTAPNNFEALFFNAICNIELDEFDSAKKELQNLTNSPVNFYTDDGLWYLALLYLRNADYSKAREKLSSINEESAYFSLSQKLQKKIEDK